MRIKIISCDIFGNKYEHTIDKVISITTNDEELFILSKTYQYSKRYPIDNVEEIEVII